MVFVLRGDYYYICGGDEGTKMFKLPIKCLVGMFFDKDKRILFLNVSGSSWHKASYYIEGESTGYEVIYLPKGFLMPLPRLWDNLTEDKIKSYNLWCHLFIRLSRRIPEGYNLTYILAHKNNPAIIDLDLTLSENN